MTDDGPPMRELGDLLFLLIGLGAIVLIMVLYASRARAF